MSASAVAERAATTDGECGPGAEAAESAPDLRAHVSFTGQEELGLEHILRIFGQPPEDGTDAAEDGRWLTDDEIAARIVEDLPPGPAMAGWLATTAPANQNGFALAGMAAAWRRLAAWATAGELATVAEITARGAARDGSDELGPGGRPGQVSDGAAAEIGLALRMSRFGAEMWADLAVTLNWRLPRTLTALSRGAIDLSRARLIAEATSVLDDAGAAAVEDKVLENAGWQTPGQLRATLRRAVISVDPAAAERRREEAERRASVGLYGDPEGTATLAGHNLPGGQAVAALARVTALAQAMKAAGAAGGIDLLRAQVFIGLLLNTLPFIPPPQEDPGAPGAPGPGAGGPAEQDADGPPGEPTGDGTPPGKPMGDGTPAARSSSGNRPLDGSRPFPDGRASAADGIQAGTQGLAERKIPATQAATAARGATAGGIAAPPWPGLPARGDVPSAGCPPGRAGRVTLTVPWQTLTGTSPGSGTLCWLGPVTPVVARQIAEAGADDPRTEWRVIVTSSSGEFISVARIRRRAGPRSGPHDATAGGPSQGRTGAGLIDRVTVTVPADLLDQDDSLLGQDGSLLGQDSRERARSGKSRLPAMLAATLTTARRAYARAAPAAPHRARSPATCGHPDHEPQYRPSNRLRAIIVARDQTCRFPGCRQPAWHTDLDHSIAYQRGGPTCSCNLGAACRSHHKVKQERGWRLEQPVPGFFTWITPSGRRYDVTPDAYPV